MSKFKKEVLEKEKYEFPEYTKEQLKEFERELESYKITKNIQGKDYTFYDEEKYMVDNNAKNKYGAVIVTGYCQKTNWTANPPYQYSFCDYPAKYEIIKDKIEQLYKMQGKKEYAIKKSLESLEENMQVVNETKVNEF